MAKKKKKSKRKLSPFKLYHMKSFSYDAWAIIRSRSMTHAFRIFARKIKLTIEDTRFDYKCTRVKLFT